MRVWLLNGRQGADPGGLECLLRELVHRPECSQWSVSLRLLGSDLAPEVRQHQPEVLVLAEAGCPAGPWATEVLELGVSLVVATSEQRAEPFRLLAEHHPVHLIPPAPTAETLALTLVTARAGLLRQRHWQGQVDQLQQRLRDRIVVERAKGILVQRLGISEEEAYKRLRVQSRRQRRQIRDIAQSLLDTQSLLNPQANGFFEHRIDERPEERPEGRKAGERDQGHAPEHLV
jgi:response regulator NasT